MVLVLSLVENKWSDQNVYNISLRYPSISRLLVMTVLLVITGSGVTEMILFLFRTGS